MHQNDFQEIDHISDDGFEEIDHIFDDDFEKIDRLFKAANANKNDI